MVAIPPGTFKMGGKSDQAYQDELPRHEVKLSSFLMDETEVTNRQFQKFIEATGYKTVAERDIDWGVMKMQLAPGTPKPIDSVLKAGSLVFKQSNEPVPDLNDHNQWWTWTIGANWKRPEGPNSSLDGRQDHPVVHVAWEDANAFAKWVGKRLPTEAEWEWAAMGGNINAKYPWGGESIDKASDKANFWQGIFPYKNNGLDGYQKTAPVKTYPPNAFGLYDMAGNVWEWCQDKYDANQYLKDKRNEPILDPKGSSNYNDPRLPYSESHVIRGGSFLCNDSYCSGYRVSRRMSSTKDSGFNHTGFRCVKDY